jgi:hypothetical protein
MQASPKNSNAPLLKSMLQKPANLHYSTKCRKGGRQVCMEAAGRMEAALGEPAFRGAEGEKFKTEPGRRSFLTSKHLNEGGKTESRSAGFSDEALEKFEAGDTPAGRLSDISGPARKSGSQPACFSGLLGERGRSPIKKRPCIAARLSAADFAEPAATSEPES